MAVVAALNHVAIAVRSIDAQRRFYEDVLGLTCEGVEEIPDQQVRVAFFRIGAVRIELVEPTDPGSSVARFLEKRGPGLHHLACTVADLPACIAALKRSGARLIDDQPRPGAHGMTIAFLHPQSTGGVLIELCQPQTPTPGDNSD